MYSSDAIRHTDEKDGSMSILLRFFVISRLCMFQDTLKADVPGFQNQRESLIIKTYVDKLNFSGSFDGSVNDWASIEP